MSDRQAYREKIDKHLAAGTCHICGKPVVSGTPIHGLTGAHWRCEAKGIEDFNVSAAKVDAAFAALGIKPKRKKVPEGEGLVAKKATEKAVAALEKHLCNKVRDVKIWNQQGAYRGPQWDLDRWGLSCQFETEDMHVTVMMSTLDTMTACAKAKTIEIGVDDVRSPWTFSFHVMT